MVNYWNSMANVPSGFADNIDNVGGDWGGIKQVSLLDLLMM